ncbi:hypothetical protein WJX73_004880 [Symbiochloris irregularis]|uniref:Uncharacterized protein n=1 Tax=Symbiochloris irregularis TaxID=706552 RepID=A0AAW1PWW7_9CHLO
MKDMKGKAAQQPPNEFGKAPAAAPKAPQSNFVPEATMTNSQPHTQRPVEAAGVSSTRKPAQLPSPSPSKDPFAGSDFGSLLGDGNFSKPGRPMRANLKATATPQGGSVNDWTIDTQSAASDAFRDDASMSAAASVTSQQSAAQLAAQPDPFEQMGSSELLARSAPGASADPFDLFGAQPAASAHAAAQPGHPGLLQGFGGLSPDMLSSPEASYSAQAGDPFAAEPFFSVSPGSQPAAVQQAASAASAQPRRPEAPGNYFSSSRDQVASNRGESRVGGGKSSSNWTSYDVEPSAPRVPRRREANEEATADGGAERANSFSEPEGEPVHFHDWAARIEEMPPERAASTLNALSEPDRLKVQRILDEKSVERTSHRGRTSPPSVEIPPQRNRRSEAVSRSSAASPTSYPDSPRSFEDNSRQAEAISRDVHAALSSPKKSREMSGHASAFSSPTISPTASASTSRKSLSEMGRPQQSTSSPPPAPSMATPSAPPPPAAQPDADFLGFSDGPAQPSHSHAAAPDLMGGMQPPGTSAGIFSSSPPKPQQPAQQRATAPADELDIFASPKAGAAPAASAYRDPADIFSTAAPASRGQQTGAGVGMMMDFGDEAGADSEVSFAAVGDVDVEGEPELRKELRAQRLARTRARMQEQLKEKQERDAREAAQQVEKGDLRSQLRPRIDAWQAGKKDNIRALLASLDTIMWEGSGWTKPGMADLVDKGKVKRAYMRANLIVHPDKVAQKGGTTEQVVIADMAFDALKMAWAKFEAGELRS